MAQQHGASSALRIMIVLFAMIAVTATASVGGA
jgi:hypothetical protein